MPFAIALSTSMTKTRSPSTGYEAVLQSGFKDYILHGERISLISSNREGIFGCIGYLSLLLLGLHFGYMFRRAVLHKEVKNERLHDTAQSSFKLISLFAKYIVLLWGAVILGERYVDMVSRRMVNF